MKVFIDERWLGEHGIGRFATEVNDRLRLPAAGLPRHPTHPLDTFAVSRWLGSHPDQVLFSPGYNAPFRGLNRYVFVVHDLNHVDMPHNSSALKRVYYNHVLRPACRRAAAVLTVSHFTAQRISAWSGMPLEKIVVVGNGVSASFRQGVAAHREANPYFFVVGNRKGHKNEARVIKAFAAMPDRQTQLLFSGAPSEELSRLGAELGVTDRMRFVGRLDEASLASHYAGALAIVFPSLYEGFGLPVVEAMACGTPVITSTTTSLPEVAGDAALLVDPESVEQISQAMQRLLHDPALREELRTRGFVQARKFSWDEVANRVGATLTEVAGQALPNTKGF